MSYKVGDRVGAILGADGQVVEFLGYGVYQGDLEAPGGPFGMSQEEFEKETGTRYKNPCIKLDNGDTVWGYQCWWGAEEKIKKVIAGAIENGKSVVEIRIDDAIKRAEGQ